MLSLDKMTGAPASLGRTTIVYNYPDVGPTPFKQVGDIRPEARHA